MEKKEEQAKSPYRNCDLVLGKNIAILVDDVLVQFFPSKDEFSSWVGFCQRLKPAFASP